MAVVMLLNACLAMTISYRIHRHIAYMRISVPVIKAREGIQLTCSRFRSPRVTTDFAHGEGLRVWELVTLGYARTPKATPHQQQSATKPRAGSEKQPLLYCLATVREKTQKKSIVTSGDAS